MDDNATGGVSLTWLHEAQRTHPQISFSWLPGTHPLLLFSPTASTLSLYHASKTVQSYMASHLCGRPTPLSNPAHASNCVAAANQLLFPPRGFGLNDVLSIPRTLAFLRCSTPLLATVSAKRLYFQTSPSRLRTSSSSILRPSAVKLPRPPPPCWAYFSTPPYATIAPDLSPVPTLSPRFNYSDLEQQQINKVFSSMERRIRAASPLHLSFRDRTLYLSFYVLSLPHYHHSTLLPSPCFSIATLLSFVNFDAIDIGFRLSTCQVSSHTLS